MPVQLQVSMVNHKNVPSVALSWLYGKKQFLWGHTVLQAGAPFCLPRFTVELAVGPAPRLRVKVTVVEDPQAPLPDCVFHSASCLHQNRLEPPPYSSTFSFTPVILKSNFLILAHPNFCFSLLHFNLFFTSIPRQKQHIPPFLPSCACLMLPCLSLSPPGWFLQQIRQEFCLWCPGLSPGAVTWQHCPPLRASCCCNYLWHPCSGASTQVTW